MYQALFIDHDGVFPIMKPYCHLLYICFATFFESMCNICQLAIIPSPSILLANYHELKLGLWSLLKGAMTDLRYPTHFRKPPYNYQPAAVSPIVIH